MVKYSQATLRRGAKTEQKEHHVPYFLAQKIARDHLNEDPRYYTFLGRMERQMEKKKRRR